MAGATPALTYTPAFGVDNSHAGTLQLSNGSANAHSVLGSVATTSNTVDLFATVPTNLDLFYCAVSSTTCTLTDAGYAYNSIPNADLAHSTISGIALGNNLDTLTFGTHLAAGGSSYNGSAGVTITSDATNANTASTIVARDASGNFTAGTITANLTGTASSATTATTATTTTNLAGTTTNSLPYQSASATTSYIAPFANSVLVTNGSSVPSESTTLPTGISATSMSLTTPVLGTPTSGVITNLTGTCATCVAHSALTATAATNLSGTSTNSVPYQSASATTSYFTSAGNAVMVTNGSGVPSESATLPAGLTIPSATLSGGSTVVPSGGTLTVQSGGTLTCAAGSTCPGGAGITSVQLVMPTSSIGANSCTSPASVTMAGLIAPSGVTPGSTFTVAYEGNPTAITGWGGSGGLSLKVWVSATNTMQWSVCNVTGSGITPGALDVDVGAK